MEKNVKESSMEVSMEVLYETTEENGGMMNEPMEKNGGILKNNVRKPGNNVRRSGNVQYTLIITAVVLAIIIVFNLLVRNFGSAYTRLDISSSKIYELTDITEKFVKNIDKEVYIYTIAEAGREDEIVETVVGRYMALNGKIKHETINPVENPQFISDYNIKLSQGSLVVMCGEKSRGIDKSEMMYKQKVVSGEERDMLDIEGKITSALAYVTSDDTPKAYMLMGVEKSVFEDEVEASLTKQNIDLEKLNITEKKKIPDDAKFLILYAPQKDITDEERELISEYMNNGGSIIYIQYLTTNEDVSYENTGKLFKDYGISFPAGNVIESDKAYYVDGEKPFQIYPVINDHEITMPLKKEKMKIMYMISNRIQIGDVPDGVKVDTLLQTSHSAYLKNANDATMMKLPTDVSGVFDLAVAIEDTNKKGKAVVFASYAIADPTCNNSVNGANVRMLVNSALWITGQSELTSVEAKFFGLSRLIFTAEEKQKILIFTVFLIPISTLGYGLSVWIRRRRR